MNAIQLLRAMHADTKVRFKVILASEDPADANARWRALKPLLELHETLEDEFVYTPAAEASGPGTPLGDWDRRHEADVAVVQQLIAAVDPIDPSTPQWRTAVARVADALSKHVMDEEGQIFGRIEQVWGPERLAAVGAEMQRAKDKATQPAARAGSQGASAPMPARARSKDTATPTRRKR